MNCYQDVQIVKDFKFGAFTCMAALFGKLHFSLAWYAMRNIGISFPEYGDTLGNVIRIHGSYTAISKLRSTCWFESLSDCCKASKILPVPKVKGWRVVRGLSSYPDSSEECWQTAIGLNALSVLSPVIRKPCPSILIKDLSTARASRLYISQGELQRKQTSGLFTFYGVSESTTIPWF